LKRFAIFPALVALALAACKPDKSSDAGVTGGLTTPFDGARAMKYVQTQVDFGPRIPGSDGWKSTGDWIVALMRARADTVLVQEWTHTTRDGKPLPMRNVFARFNPKATERVLYVTHWDSRPIADSDPVPANRTKPVTGANDGASGVALFIALGDALKATPPSVGVDLLFVDGEDYGSFDTGKDQDVLIGSRYFAEHLPSADYRPIFGVLWDMIGDRDLQIYQEGNSVQAAPEVVQRVWDTARRYGHANVFIPEQKWTVTDDHIPLIKAGLRVIDVIDLDYKGPNGTDYHHTTQDTPDKVSGQSLKAVGDVALALVK
jgi:glutaminyl-peptide cyclotransferase